MLGAGRKVRSDVASSYHMSLGTQYVCSPGDESWVTGLQPLASREGGGCGVLCRGGGGSGGGTSEGRAPQFPVNPGPGGSSGRSGGEGVVEFVLVRPVHGQWALIGPEGEQN